jgi:hypothetical protein
MTEIGDFPRKKKLWLVHSIPLRVIIISSVFLPRSLDLHAVLLGAYLDSLKRDGKIMR